MLRSVDAFSSDEDEDEDEQKLQSNYVITEEDNAEIGKYCRTEPDYFDRKMADRCKSVQSFMK